MKIGDKVQETYGFVNLLGLVGWNLDSRPQTPKLIVILAFDELIWFILKFCLKWGLAW